MSKIKNYIIGGLLVFLVILAWQLQRKEAINTALTSENERLALNVEQLLAKDKQQTALILTKDEFIVSMTDSVGKLLKSLAIKPKQVIKYIEREVKEVIRDTVEVESEWLKDVTWKLSDKDKCWRWEAEATLNELDLDVNRTFFEYKNASTDIYYWQRKKILFLRIGKKDYYQKHLPECGTESIREITIIKK